MAKLVNLEDAAGLSGKACIAKLMQTRNQVAAVAKSEAGNMVMHWQAEAPYKTGFMADNIRTIKSGKYGVIVGLPEYRPDNRASMLVVNSQNKKGPNRRFANKILANVKREFYNKATNKIKNQEKHNYDYN